MKDKKGAYKKVGIGILVLLLIVVAVVVLNPDSGTIHVGDDAENGIVEINGKKCRHRQNIETYLFMGSDQVGKVQEEDEGGQADVFLLLILDKTKNTYSLLSLNRDTICEVRSYSEEGEDLGTSFCQLALSHASGTTQTMCCENSVEAVSTLLLKEKITGYTCLNMDAIKVLNHAVGGVTVTIEDDFSDSDPSLKMGETITLDDEQAFHYIHDRKNVEDGMNENRMKRQKTYLSNMKDALIQHVKEDKRYAEDVFTSLDDYQITDITNSDISKICNALTKYEDNGFYEFAGKNEVGRFDWIEFNIDEESFYETMIALFYEEV